jgi:hypothetical protein
MYTSKTIINSHGVGDSNFNIYDNFSTRKVKNSKILHECGGIFTKIKIIILINNKILKIKKTKIPPHSCRILEFLTFRVEKLSYMLKLESPTP